MCVNFHAKESQLAKGAMRARSLEGMIGVSTLGAARPRLPHTPLASRKGRKLVGRPQGFAPTSVLLALRRGRV